MPLILLTGLPNSGKTKTCEALVKKLNEFFDDSNNNSPLSFKPNIIYHSDETLSIASYKKASRTEFRVISEPNRNPRSSPKYNYLKWRSVKEKRMTAVFLPSIFKIKCGPLYVF